MEALRVIVKLQTSKIESLEAENKRLKEKDMIIHQRKTINPKERNRKSW